MVVSSTKDDPEWKVADGLLIEPDGDNGQVFYQSRTYA